MTRPTSPWQRGLQHFNGHLFVPSSGTDPAGKGLGAAWTTDTAGVGVVVAHATPATAFDTQMRRTTYTQVVTTTNQELGPRQSATSEYVYWPGNARFLGGFYMSAVFRIEAWNNDAGRLFVGMTAKTTSMAISDTIANDTCGLWHDSTMAQDELWFITQNNGGTPANTQLTQHVGAGHAGVVEVSGLLATGVTIRWEMWQYPNRNVGAGVNCRLNVYDVATDSAEFSQSGLTIPYNRVRKIKWMEQGNTLTNTKFMAPQVQMSNGADAVAGHFSLGVANIYCDHWSGEMD